MSITEGMKKDHYLYDDKPADPRVWEQAYPLGNGFLGAMIYGGVDQEVISLNQESVWYGGPRERVNPDALTTLPKVRKLLFEGALSEAEEAAYCGMFGVPMSQGHYEPLADLKLVYNKTVPHHSEFGKERSAYSQYERVLDLTQGIHQVSYKLGDTIYRRKAFISYPDRVMAIELSTLYNKPFDLRIELERGDLFESVKAVNGNSIVLQGSSGGNGPSFATMVSVNVTGGTMEQQGSYLQIQDAVRVVLLLTASTTYYNHEPLYWCNEVLENAGKLGYDELLQRHITDYKGLYDRVDFSLGKSEEENNLTKKPTALRLERVKQGYIDQGLLSLYFHYGRYLLISSSRPGSLPANLQGKWNKEMQPPWGSKYTININLQMNYWLAETTNLSECHEPLFDHLLKMLPKGQRVAKEMYDCRGFVAHHNTDIYGDCAPQDQWMPATLWPMGAAWLSTHILQHYEFTKDISFAEKYFPVIYEASLFFLDYLIEDEYGQLVTCPSTSPENTYILPNGQKSALCYGPSMDSQIIGELWQGTLKLAGLLEKEDETYQMMAQGLESLPKTRLGSRGQILEWTKEYAEWEPGHRHISHLYALHPGNSITESETPELFHGAETTLKERLSSGGGHTGWSRAWIINMWARLKRGDEAYDNILMLLTHSTADNLFDMHPPFQIDGNFGGTAGIAEMLLQSHEGFIRLLPALPEAWPSGMVKGLMARNGIEVSLSWEGHKIKSAVFTAICDTVLRVMLQDKLVEKPLKQGQSYYIDEC